MDLFPAIDLREGRAVRLYQGDYDRMTVYNPDPAAQARAFEAAGARCLHVVDLDGARDGTTANLESIRAIAGGCGLYIEVGGGIRDEARIGPTWPGGGPVHPGHHRGEGFRLHRPDGPQRTAPASPWGWTLGTAASRWPAGGS